MKKLIILLLSLLSISCSYESVYNESSLSELISLSEFDHYYSITPLCYEMDRAFIFYPGGLVEPNSYIPFAYRLAQELNIAVFILKMPFNLALLAGNRVELILEDYSYINTWYLGGHSLGGVVAASYINKNPEVFHALLLLASYPMKDKSLKTLPIPVLSMSGSEDGIIDRVKLRESLELLPPHSRFVEIEGANHSQFGSYGMQRGDMDPLISEEEQQKKIIIEFRTLLEQN